MKKVPCWHQWWTVAVLPLAIAASVASADTVWIRSGTGKPLQLPPLKVNGIDGSDLSFTMQSSGLQTKKPLDIVSRIQLDDEPAFNAAEEAYENGDLKAAADGYRKATGVSSRDWVKGRAGLRLVEAANKVGDFGLAVDGFVALAGLDPKLAEAHRPEIPQDKPELLAAAIAAVKRGGGKADQQKTLLPFLAELYSAKKDTAAAGDVLEQLAKIDPEAANSPGALRARAEVRLGQSRAALASKNYAEVEKILADNDALFIDPTQQAEALYELAEVKAAAAGKDEQSLKDTALAYMRVVAYFKNVTGAPHVADSLMKTAEIEERLNKPDEAMAVYQQVSKEFKDTPAAAQASQNASRIAAAIKAGK